MIDNGGSNRLHSYSFIIPTDDYQEALSQFKDRLKGAFPKRFLKRGALENEIKKNWKLTNLSDWIK